MRLTRTKIENIIHPRPAETPPGGRLQIGTMAGFISERVAGFILECLAGFVGIRSVGEGRKVMILIGPNAITSATGFSRNVSAPAGSAIRIENQQRQPSQRMNHLRRSKSPTLSSLAPACSRSRGRESISVALEHRFSAAVTDQ